jgi:hypothetical protein
VNGPHDLYGCAGHLIGQVAQSLVRRRPETERIVLDPHVNDALVEAVEFAAALLCLRIMDADDDAAMPLVPSK